MLCVREMRVRPLVSTAGYLTLDQAQCPGGLTNVAADKHIGMRLRRNGDNVLAAELRR